MYPTASAPGAVPFLVGAMGTGNKVAPLDDEEAALHAEHRESARLAVKEKGIPLDKPQALKRGDSFKAVAVPAAPNQKQSHDDHELDLPKGTQTFYCHGKEFMFAKR
jgi:hypothetical protein